MQEIGMRKYCLTSSRLEHSLREGFQLKAGGILSAEKDVLHRHCLLTKLDSNVLDCPWGRLKLSIRQEGDLVLTLRVMASNEKQIISRDTLTELDAFLLDPQETMQRKEQLFGMGNGLQQSGASDMLLYGQTGRYLWIWMELHGIGTADISDVRVYAPGDNFYATFPEVYRNDGEFFHRYLSIFSSMYNDFQEKIDRLDHYLDADTAPVELLPLLANWLGLYLDGDILEENELRRLLKAAYPLISAKGTRRAMEMLIRLFVEEPVYIVERNLLGRLQWETSGGLYGDTPFDFTILIRCRADERLRRKLYFLVEQFKPMRSRANIVFLGEGAALDAFSYLDINGSMLESRPGCLDDGEALTGMTYLQ